jgi:thiamine-phosphate pyrophosphorylase
MIRAPRLLVISDRARMGKDPPAAVVRLAMAGLDAFQWREKDLPPLATYRRLEELRRALDAADTTMRLIVNDRVDIALALALGVHIPEEGLPTSVARIVLGHGTLIGRSTHSLEAARAARDGGADYVTFGPVFATPSKMRYGPPLGLDALREVCGTLAPFPVLALGGVSWERIEDCMLAGAFGVAAIGGIWDAGNPAEQLARYRAELESGAGPGAGAEPTR